MEPVDTHLFAKIDGRHVLMVSADGPIVRRGEDLEPNKELVLSPDGKTVVTTLQVSAVAARWQDLYPPPFASAPFRVQAGKPADQFVQIDLESGKSRPLVDAPTADSGGWFLPRSGWRNSTLGAPTWSKDSSAVLLPGAYVPTKDGSPANPCAAVVELATNRISCVQRFEIPDDPSPSKIIRLFRSASFVNGKANRVRVISDYSDGSHHETEYRERADGEWIVGATGPVQSTTQDGELGLAIRQSVNEPPTLVAEARGRSRVIWDPNPQLKSLELGQAEVYRWQDASGREWTGGLYTPPHSAGTKPFPLVIQTHGFDPYEFAPSGWKPSGLAARALQGAGIMVLQVRENCTTTAPDEARCAVAGYEAAVRQLTSAGLVDPTRIGIVGFSRTCLYAMQALTQSNLPIAAALVTDGVMLTYVQYILSEGIGNEDQALGADPVIGAAPFGAGLQEWLKHSSGFNLDKVKAPLRVVGQGPTSLLFMWEPYAALRYLHKPVDLILLNTNQHNPLNPAVRMASQGGAVDWFRFWLKHEEDPSADKAAQYQRWRTLLSRDNGTVKDP
jgi:dipeptidyl aminopeptidase/acylaminoacyl peptidase